MFKEKLLEFSSGVGKQQTISVQMAMDNLLELLLFSLKLNDTWF